MAQLHISALNPELSAVETKHFRATVTLIWPYSSSTRQFAILLAEPELRLRRKNGQVRVRFSGASAKAIATTGVGIGDEVVLSLRGAQFVQEGVISTPGRSIDWELSYTQTVVVQVVRDGSEVANLELVDAASTPAPRSPVRRETIAAPTPAHPSPAFLKRARLSDGPFFEAPYDLLAEEDDNDKGHDKKRRRKSYKDWKTWTFGTRTPSPEKEDVPMEDELDLSEASPSRAAQLPHTPVSPSKADILPVAATPLDRPEGGEEGLEAETDKAAVSMGYEASGDAPAHDRSDAMSEQVENVRDADYYNLYAGPDEFPPSDAQYAFGGDTEVDTEVNTEEEKEPAHGEPDVVSISSTEADTEKQESSQPQHTVDEVVDTASVASKDDDEERDVDQVEVQQSNGASDQDDRDDGNASTISPLMSSSSAPRIVRPPPTLSTLHTDVPTSVAGGMLTPIGREPESPTLRPQDSATLPLPSPFPEERDASATSYFGNATTTQPAMEVYEEAAEEQHLPSEASYIGETSFFSSIGSKASAFHPNHESAFTPVRFTFGMDGAGFSRPMELSSPEPEVQADELSETKGYIPASSPPPETLTALPREDVIPDTIDEYVEEPAMTASETSGDETQEEPEVIVLSSDSESEESEGDYDDLSHEEQDAQLGFIEEIEEDIATEDDTESVTEDIPNDQMLQQQDEQVPTSTRHSAATTAIVDLGSPSEYSSDIEIQETEQHKSLLVEERPTITPPDHEEEQPGSHSEFVNLDSADEDLNATKAPEKQTVTHTSSQETVMDADPLEVEQPVLAEDSAPPPPIEASDDYLQDAFPTGDFPEAPEWQQPDEEERHPDIKVESIEEDSSFHVDEPGTGAVPGDQNKTSNEPSGELLIAVPEEGHKLGELHTISVPTTGPARNTRSKAKTSMSPTKEETPMPKRTTRSTRSKPSVTPIARTAVSSSKPRTRSTMSASQDAAQTSPYSLRSQSHLLTPTKTSITAPAATRRSPRKHAQNRSVDSTSGMGHSQDRDPFCTSFLPSQEIGASQRSRFSDVAYVKDSDEEQSVRSEHSLSTVLHSDDWGMAGIQYNYSDPIEHATLPDEDQTDIKPPPGTAPELRRIPSAKTQWRKTESKVVNLSSSPSRPDFSFITKPTASSPNRRLRSAGSIEAASPSTRNVRKTRRHVYDLSPEPEEIVEELSGETTPKASREPDKHVSPGEGKGRQNRSQLSSQQRTIDVDELMRSSPHTGAHTYRATNRQLLLNSNKPMTPDATQQTTMELQTRSTATRQRQSTLITPQLTQTTSAGLRSFQTDVDADMEHTAISKATPRRDTTATDIASKSPSPTLVDPSSDVDSHTLDAPSVGLSTPLAYYTPLKELLYFLNRSSQFHSAANPDVLALVISSTTSPERAKKGPKHWGTTLHITDASSWPSTTSVQIFRAYQNALPEAHTGDVILLRAFAVKSLNRQPMLVSADESSWCVWRYGKPLWGAKRGAWGELRAREEMKGPTVERGEGEWREVEKLRTWYMRRVKEELEERAYGTRSQDKGKGKAVEVEEE
jgi:hypothetical protein